MSISTRVINMPSISSSDNDGNCFLFKDEVSAELEHNFAEFSDFSLNVYPICQVCNKKLHDIVLQGFKCRVCSLICHRKCITAMLPKCKRNDLSLSDFDSYILLCDQLTTSAGENAALALVKCFAELERRSRHMGINLVEVYKRSSSTKQINWLKTYLKKNDFDDQQYFYDITIAATAKRILLELAEPVITTEFYSEFISATKTINDNICLQKLSILVQNLPLHHYQLLHIIMCHLCKVFKLQMEYHQANSLLELSRIFCHLLIRPPWDKITDLICNTKHHIRLLLLLIKSDFWHESLPQTFFLSTDISQSIDFNSPSRMTSTLPQDLRLSHPPPFTENTSSVSSTDEGLPLSLVCSSPTFAINNVEKHNYQSRLETEKLEIGTVIPVLENRKIDETFWDSSAFRIDKPVKNIFDEDPLLESDSFLSEERVQFKNDNFFRNKSDHLIKEKSVKGCLNKKINCFYKFKKQFSLEENFLPTTDKCSTTADDSNKSSQKVPGQENSMENEYYKEKYFKYFYLCYGYSGKELAYTKKSMPIYIKPFQGKTDIFTSEIKEINKNSNLIFSVDSFLSTGYIDGNKEVTGNNFKNPIDSLRNSLILYDDDSVRDVVESKIIENLSSNSSDDVFGKLNFGAEEDEEEDFIRRMEKPETSENNVSIGERGASNLLENQVWYWGDVGREEANELLNGTEDGTYLVRNGSIKMEKNFTLVLRCSGTNKLIKILHKDNKYGFAEPFTFSSVVELIRHYQQNSLSKHNKSLDLKLQHALPKDFKSCGCELDKAQFQLIQYAYKQKLQEYQYIFTEYTHLTEELQMKHYALEVLKETIQVLKEQLEIQEIFIKIANPHELQRICDNVILLTGRLTTMVENQKNLELKIREHVNTNRQLMYNIKFIQIEMEKMQKIRNKLIRFFLKKNINNDQVDLLFKNPVESSSGEMITSTKQLSQSIQIYNDFKSLKLSQSIQIYNDFKPLKLTISAMAHKELDRSPSALITQDNQSLYNINTLNNCDQKLINIYSSLPDQLINSSLQDQLSSSTLNSLSSQNLNNFEKNSLKALLSSSAINFSSLHISISSEQKSPLISPFRLTNNNSLGLHSIDSITKTDSNNNNISFSPAALDKKQLVNSWNSDSFSTNTMHISVYIGADLKTGVVNKKINLDKNDSNFTAKIKSPSIITDNFINCLKASNFNVINNSTNSIDAFISKISQNYYLTDTIQAHTTRMTSSISNNFCEISHIVIESINTYCQGISSCKFSLLSPSLFTINNVSNSTTVFSDIKSNFNRLSTTVSDNNNNIDPRLTSSVYKFMPNTLSSPSISSFAIEQTFSFSSEPSINSRVSNVDSPSDTSFLPSNLQIFKSSRAVSPTLLASLNSQSPLITTDKNDKKRTMEEKIMNNEKRTKNGKITNNEKITKNENITNDEKITKIEKRSKNDKNMMNELKNSALIPHPGKKLADSKLKVNEGDILQVSPPRYYSYNCNFNSKKNDKNETLPVHCLGNKDLIDVIEQETDSPIRFCNEVKPKTSLKEKIIMSEINSNQLQLNHLIESNWLVGDDWLESDWFIDGNRFESENILACKPRGTFLIRPSSDGQYALSIVSADTIVHCKIYKGENGYGFSEPFLVHKTLTDLVVHYKDVSLAQFNSNVDVKLKYPINAPSNVYSP